MSRRLSAFFKYAVAYVAFSLPIAVSAADALVARELALSDRGGKPLRVGDTVAYDLRGGDAHAEARWEIDPKQGGLKQGILFRKGRLITPLAPGKIALPALNLIDENGQTVAQTSPLEFSVESNLSPPAAGAEGNAAAAPTPEPAIGPLGLPIPLWVQSAVGSAILIAALLLVFFAIRALKRRAARALHALRPKKPYDVAALDRLDALLGEGWIEKGEYKPFYFGISETLKFYFGERFDFDARESTTSELHALLRERVGFPGLTEGLLVRVERLFSELNPVKFADVVPTAGETRAVHREARDIVASTRKLEPVGPEAKR
jgi:hypothetical protein